MEDLAIKIIKVIEMEAHTSGLTNRVSKLLEAEVEQRRANNVG
jgi:exosome complex RNA-binding protein Rrp4